MTYRQIKEVVGLYRDKVNGLSIQHDGALQHVLWMCDKIDEMIDEIESISECVRKDFSKINRWLGFIQGVLYTCNIYTIDQMREHNRYEQEDLPESKAEECCFKCIEFKNTSKQKKEVNFSSLNLKEKGDLSGRVIYKREEYDEDDSVIFFCGPETDDGYIEDSGVYTDKTLEKIFSDMLYPNIHKDNVLYVSIGDAENFHSANVPDNMLADEVWEIIEEKLISAGAVKMEE